MTWLALRGWYRMPPAPQGPVGGFPGFPQLAAG
jgi:hypothetical protein